MISLIHLQSGSMLKTSEAIHAATHRSRRPPACSGCPRAREEEGPRRLDAPPGGCGGTLAIATVADTMRVISRSGEQLFARHQFGVVHMHPLEVCALALTCSKAPYALHPAPCTLHHAPCILHPATGRVQAHLAFVGDATWRVESGLSPCDDAARARAATLRRIAKEEAAALAGLP